MKAELYMRRCLQLAKLAKGQTHTNPLVGAILVYNDRIIGEGYHTQYGANHGEIEALNSVVDSDRHLIPKSTLFVNLEPCCHYGKTPPCTDEIIRQGIKKVVIGTQDPNPKIKGKGIKKLIDHGVEVTLQVLEDACNELNQVFFTNMNKLRPYIILKYACSQDNFIGNYHSAVAISNTWSRYIVHKIRHEVDGILIGTKTAIIDNPQLSTRHFYGKSPIRIVLDRRGKIPLHYQIFTDCQPTWIFTDAQINWPAQVKRFAWMEQLQDMMLLLLTSGIGSLLVEGGAMTLQSFIDHQLWDEIWVTQSIRPLGGGVSSPVFKGKKVGEACLDQDILSVYKPF